MVQLSHLYMIIGNNIVLTIWTFVGKVMSLLCKMVSRFLIAIYFQRFESLLGKHAFLSRISKMGINSLKRILSGMYANNLRFR